MVKKFTKITKNMKRKLNFKDPVIKVKRRTINALGKATDGIMRVPEMIKIEKWLESKGKRGGRRTRKKRRGGRLSAAELAALLKKAQRDVDNMIGEEERKKRMVGKKAAPDHKPLSTAELYDKSLDSEIVRKADADAEAKILADIQKTEGGKRKTRKRRRKKSRKRKRKKKSRRVKKRK